MNMTTARKTSATSAAAASATKATITAVPSALRWLAFLLIGSTLTLPPGSVGFTVGSVRSELGVEPVVVDVVVWGVIGALLGPPVPNPRVGSVNAGVGSNGIQPAPVIHTSGHACALWFVTWKRPSAPIVPGW